MGFNEVVNHLSLSSDIISIALGGSRSRGQHKKNSDYDLFCVICDSSFDSFKHSFRSFLEKIPCILYAAELFYLENWGYVFKAIDVDDVMYDISIIPKSRIKEMSVRSTNIVIKDTNNFFQENIECANDEQFLVSEIECHHFYDYGVLFGFERDRFFDAVEKEDFWYAVRCLERMKNYLIRCDRIQRNDFSKNRSCPEKEYNDLNDCLKRIYIISCSFEVLEQTTKDLCKLFSNLIQDKEVCTRSRIKCY